MARRHEPHGNYGDGGFNANRGQERPILSRVESSWQPRLATLAGVTSLAAGISTSLLRETRLASTAAGFLVGLCYVPHGFLMSDWTSRGKAGHGVEKKTSGR